MEQIEKDLLIAFSRLAGFYRASLKLNGFLEADNFSSSKERSLDRMAGHAAYYRGQASIYGLVIDDDEFLNLAWEYQDFLKLEKAQ